jgi:CBS domain-containing protein
MMLRRLREVADRLSPHGRSLPVPELIRTPLQRTGGRSLLDLLLAAAQGVPTDNQIAIGLTAIADRFASADTRREPFAEGALRHGIDDTVDSVMSRDVVSVEGEASLKEAAVFLREADIGELVVLDDGRFAGVLTDRDIVVRAVAGERDPLQTTAGSVCTRDVAVIAPSASVEQAVDMMVGRAVRRLPVVEKGQVVGIVSLADLVVLREPESVLAAIVAAPGQD